MSMHEAVESYLLGMEQIMGREITSDAIDLWTAILESEGVTLEEFRLASVAVAKRSRFFPKPVEVLEEVAELRRIRRAQALESRMRGLVDAVDSEGRACLVRADLIGKGFEPAPEPEPRPLSPGAAELLRKVAA